MEKGKVTILRGTSGAGKSTLAGTFVGAVVVSADDFFVVHSEYRFDARKLGEAHRQCLKRYLWLLTNNATWYGHVVVDNTNTTVEEIAPYYALAEAYEREVEIVTVDAPIKTCVERNVHKVDRETIEQQFTRLHKIKMPKWWRHRVVTAAGVA